MPPSGYKNEEALFITYFLKSIGESLIKEGKEKKLSPCDALKRECNNIDSIVKTKCTKYQSTVLFLTKHYYTMVLLEKPDSYNEVRSIMEKQLKIVESDIVQVHVPEI